MGMASTGGEAGGAAAEPWVLIRQVLEKGRADGLDDVQLSAGIYTVLRSHSLIADPDANPATVGELYDQARRELGEGGEDFEFKATRERSGGGLALSVSNGSVYALVHRNPTGDRILCRITEYEPVPEGFAPLVREAVAKIRRQQVPA